MTTTDIRYCDNGCGYKLLPEYGTDETTCGACLDTPTWSVWVGGSEINDNLLTLDEAKQVAERWSDLGYDDVHIDNGDKQ